MSSKTRTPLNTSNNQDEKGLRQFIAQYSAFLGEHQSDVHLTGDMLDLGTKTELAQQFEEWLDNPMKVLLDIKTQTDESATKFVERIIKHFMSKMKESNLVDSAFRRKGNGNDLYYSVILKKDTFKNRNIIFSFLNIYSCMEIAEKIPVYFQIVPQKYSQNLIGQQTIVD